MESIYDGTNSGGYGAKVDINNRLWTLSTVQPEDRSIASSGKVWTYYFTTTPVGAGDYFFYLENTGAPKLTITDIRIMCASADVFTFEPVTGTPSYTSGADVTPTNRNGGSNLTPSATAKKDTDTTGITTAGTYFFQSCDTANKMEHLSTSSNIHLPRGSAISFKAATGTALVTCAVSVVEVTEV